MDEHNPEIVPSEIQPRHRQDWGLIMGAGLIILCVLVTAVNLSVNKLPANLIKPRQVETIPTQWAPWGRAAVLVASLGGCSWVIWQFLRRRRTTHPTRLTLALRQARDYSRSIQDLLQAAPGEHQQQLLTHIRTWQATIDIMAQALADLEQNDEIIQRDRMVLPNAVAELERQLAVETEPILQADLEQMLLQRINQQQALEQLQTARRRAEIQVERAVAVLGTIYSQLLTYRSTFHVVDYQRLANNIVREVQHLQDYVDTLHAWTPAGI